MCYMVEHEREMWTRARQGPIECQLQIASYICQVAREALSTALEAGEEVVWLFRYYTSLLRRPNTIISQAH